MAGSVVAVDRYFDNLLARWLLRAFFSDADCDSPSLVRDLVKAIGCWSGEGVACRLFLPRAVFREADREGVSVVADLVEVDCWLDEVSC